MSAARSRSATLPSYSDRKQRRNDTGVVITVCAFLISFALYRKYGVPVALTTDDEGVERIDLTHEYTTAAETFGLTYPDLKEMARNSIEYSFLPGDSLWRDHDYRHPQLPCATSLIGDHEVGTACAAVLAASPRAQQQWRLEERFHRFEQAQEPDLR